MSTQQTVSKNPHARPAVARAGETRHASRRRAHRGQRYWPIIVAALSSLLVVAVGCSSESSEPSQSIAPSQSIVQAPFRITGVNLDHPDLDDQTEVVSVSPTGSAYVFEDGFDLCVQRVDATNAEPVCDTGQTDFATYSGFDTTYGWSSEFGLSWSSDEQQVLFKGRDDSGVVLFDLRASSVDMLTRPEGDPSDPSSYRRDVAPFFGPDETMYCFRPDLEGTMELRRVDVPVVGGTLPEGWRPWGTPMQFVPDVWVFGYETSRGRGLATLTFDGDSVSIEELTIGIDEPILLDADDGKLLVVVAEGERLRAYLVVPDSGLTMELEAPDTPPTSTPSTAVKFSPDGRSIVGLWKDEVNPLAVTLWRLGDEGVETVVVDVSVDESFYPGVGLGAGRLAWDGDTTIAAIVFEGGLAQFEVEPT